MSEKKVYIAKANNCIKIGNSIDPEQRIKELQTGSPMKIELHNIIETKELSMSAPQFEKLLHKSLKSYHKSGEWFEEEGLHFLYGFMKGVEVDFDMEL